MRGALTVAAVFVAGLLAALSFSSTGTATSSGAFTLNGRVIHVVDGDTVDVRLRSGKRERIRVIGIDTPERGVCFFSQFSRRTSEFALGKNVTLRGDATQDTRDRYGRLLAYVDVNGHRDLGLALVQGGYAAVYVFREPFQRLGRYRAAAASAKGARAGAWTACSSSPPATAALPLAHHRRQRKHPPRADATRTTPSACRSWATSTVPTSGRWGRRRPGDRRGSYRLDGDNDGLGCE